MNLIMYEPNIYLIEMHWTQCTDTTGHGIL